MRASPVASVSERWGFGVFAGGGGGGDTAGVGAMGRQPPLTSKRERELIDLVRQGDRGALGELLSAYHKPIYHLCLRMVSAREDAAEVAQEALLKAVQHIDSFKGDSKFSTWLFRIAMNLCISHLRKRKVRRSVSLDAPAGRDGHGPPGGGADEAGDLKQQLGDHREPEASDRVQTDEQIDRLRAAIDGLEANLRAVILLRDLREMDYQQIAEVVGVPVGTVKSRLFRARLALRQALAGGERGGSDAADDRPTTDTPTARRRGSGEA